MAYPKDIVQPLIDINLEAALQDINIPPRPAILEHIIAETRKSDPDLNFLTRLISSDMAVSAGLIKISNSPFFSTQRRVQTIKEALMVLGLLTASRAVACISFRHAFPETPVMERFWDSSAKIARLSGWLAQSFASNVLETDEAYTFGLFRDCGIPLMLVRQPQYQDVLERANKEPDASFTSVEEMFLPTNHAVVGSMMARSWWLNDETTLSILHHHNLGVLDPATSPLSIGNRYRIAIAQLAEHLLQRQTTLCNTREWNKLGSACLNVLGLKEEELNEISEYSMTVIDADF
ncbi:MAG: HDOD domain-containing protein [Gallionellaceae bacterium]|nr:HDOD domain-containing protein [Gallionellaceae bacterium]